MSEQNATLTYEPIAWVSGMFPMYSTLGVPDDQVEKMIDSIHSTGLQSFYLMANEIIETEQKPSNNSQYTTYNNKTQTFSKIVRNKRLKLLKCSNNLVARSLSEVPHDEAEKIFESINFGAIKSSAWYNLPKMSQEFVNKVDSFFRYIYKIHGTEAIVVFTYDSTYLNSDNPSDGWGVSVPKQENTAVSCSYDHQSIIETLPDDYSHIYQVGTAHSHPMMDAYCSGTDKEDQASFDGIHITFGWKGPQTDYHIELQINGHAWSLDTDQVFDLATPEISEDVKSWSTNVVKKSPTTSFGSSYISQTGITSSKKNQDYLDTTLKVKDRLPNDIPDLKLCTLIYVPVIDLKDVEECPLCDGRSINQDTRRCYKCMTYFMSYNEDIHALVKYRENKFSGGSSDIKMSSKPHKDIWIIEETYDSNNNYAFDYYRVYASRKEVKNPIIKTVIRTSGSDINEINKEIDIASGSSEGNVFNYVVCGDCGLKLDISASQCTDCYSFNFVPPNTSTKERDNASNLKKSQITIHS